MRKRMVAGNWKMNMVPSEAVAFAKEMKDKCENDNVEVVFCVPDIDIIPVLEEVKGSNINIGAQNMHFEDSGAFTGELSPLMLKDIGVKHVILGHSERREYFGETDELVNKKVKSALGHDLIPIICCGETLEQREQDITIDLIRQQVKIALYEVAEEDIEKCVIAYEPIWAIGTGKTATSEEAEEVCKNIREVLKEMYGEDISSKVRILYGGSVNGGNAKELFSMGNIDGGLVGGASLKPEFTQVINA